MSLKREVSLTFWVVSGRYDTELMEPIICKTQKEAEKTAEGIILDYARDKYARETGKSPMARKATIKKWANENGYEFSENYFWNGGSDAVETMVTERCL